MIVEPHYLYVGFSNFFHAATLHWLSRKPMETPALYNLIKVFSSDVWLAILASLSCMASTFALLHFVYSRSTVFKELQLAGPISGWIDFPLLTFCSLTEPDPIPFFPKFSAGTGKVSDASQAYFEINSSPLRTFYCTFMDLHCL